MCSSDSSIRFGYDNMNFDDVTTLLSTAYWCRGIKIAEVKQGALNSAVVVGAFTNTEQQIGYGRVISDKTRFAYITDVIVDERYRKRGIGQLMVRAILENEELKDIYQWLLITSDAHGLYQKMGFSITKRPHDWMEIWNRRPER